MTTNDFIKLKTDQLYQELLQQLFDNCEKGKLIIDELCDTEKYKSDSEFRLNIETAKCIILVIENKHQEAVEQTTKILKALESLPYDYLITCNLNTLGNAYRSMGKVERALELYFQIISIEKAKNMCHVTSIAYQNIGLIFSETKLYEKAVEYYELAMDFSLKNKDRIPRFEEKMLVSYCEILNNYVEMGKFDNIDGIIDKIEKLNVDHMSFYVKNCIYNAMMYAYFNANEPGKAKRKYEEIKELSAESKCDLMKAVITFITLSKEKSMPEYFYTDEFSLLEFIDDELRPGDNALIYSELKNFHLEAGDVERANRLDGEYIKILEKNQRQNDENNTDSVLIIYNLINGKEKENESEYTNREHDLFAEEAIRNKNELEAAYKRIELIHSLGIKMTSSLDLEEIAEFIYENFQHNIGADYFSLLVAEPELRSFRSLVSYEFGKKVEPASISMDDPSSMIAECYRRREMVTSEDEIFRNKIQFQIDTFAKGATPSQASIFVPIIMNNEVLGVYTLQSIGIKFFRDEDIAFVKELHPFIAIALKNATYSRELSNEIERHLNTQEILKSVNDQLLSANYRLELQAGIDQLTQIKNRRSYEDRYLKLAYVAEDSGKTLTVFMLDIDDFKIYNDTFGHFEGDKILVKIAEIVDDIFSKCGGIAARFGGEEFIAACIGLSKEKSEKIAEDILQAVRDLKIENPKSAKKQITLSIGVSMSIKDHSMKKLLLPLRADENLYEAKEKGKDGYVFTILY